MGLSLRGQKAKHRPEAYAIRPYRYQAAPLTRWTKGMQHLVPSLFYHQGVTNGGGVASSSSSLSSSSSVAQIVRKTGLEPRRVECLLSWCEEGKQMKKSGHTWPYGRALDGEQETCQFHGYCQQWNEEATEKDQKKDTMHHSTNGTKECHDADDDDKDNNTMQVEK